MISLVQMEFDTKEKSELRDSEIATQLNARFTDYWSLNVTVKARAFRKRHQHESQSAWCWPNVFDIERQA